MNKFRFKVTVYLFAKVVDIYINKVGSRIKMRVPDFLRYLYPAQYSFGIFVVLMCILNVGKEADYEMKQSEESEDN